MKRIEWNTDVMQWVWRIYAGVVRTSAFIPFDGSKPRGVSDAEFNTALETIQGEDEKPF